MKRRRMISGATAAIGIGAMSRPARAGSSDPDYDTAAREIWAPIDPAGGPRELARAATLAANSHNTQPWRFTLSERLMTIRPDIARRCPAVDPDDHHLFVSLGCASENAFQAAGAMGLSAEVQFDPAGLGGLAIAFEPAPVSPSRLGAAIVRRQATRAEYDGRALPAETLNQLAAAGTMPGVDCLIITDTARTQTILDFVLQGNTAQMGDKAFMAELKSWMRFDDAQTVRMGDGLSTRASGNPSLPPWFARLLLPLVFSAKGENDKYAKQIRSSAGIAVFSSAANDKAHWALAGRACQRFALEATALGLKYAFINQPVEVPEIRAKLGAFLGLGDRRPDLVVRFGNGPEMPRALRRPIASVIDA